MKHVLIILLVFCATKSHAQTANELFRQKATQKKYLLQQIAGLHQYMEYARKGYSIAKEGLSAIDQIKQGDFRLHNNFFNSLSIVSPLVKKYSRVASIIATQISIAKLVRNTIMQCTNGQLTNTELNYLQQVFNNVLDDGAKILDKLFEVISDGAQQMKDDERIKRIDKLYGEMLQSKVFVQSFSHSARVLSIQRRNDQRNIPLQKKLNGLP